jgi:hypothetical protein
VVKLWIGDDESEQNRIHAWRGQIQHVQTGQSCTFRGPFQMLAFMDRFLVARDGTTE